MTYATQTARYLENEVLSRSPEWLVPLLYEHLLMNLRRAQVHIEANDAEGRRASLDRAAAIVGELLASLDREKGGEFAEGLAGLYTYLAIELLDIGRSLESATLRKLIELVEELHSAWVQAAEQVAPRGAASSSRSIAVSAA